MFVLAMSTSMGGSTPDRVSPVAAGPRTIAPGESHAYPFALNAGDRLRVEISQDDALVAVTLTGPDGRELAAVDPFDDEGLSTTLATIVDRSGDYTIHVRPPATAMVPGRYSMRVGTIRPAVAADREIVDAEREFAAGARLLDRAHVANRPEALEHFRASLDTFRRAGDRRGEMKALFEIAKMQYFLKEPGSLQSAREAERIARDLGDRAAVAEVLRLDGDILAYQADFTASLQSFEQDLAIARELGHRKAQLRSLNDSSFVYDQLGDAQRAIDVLQEALAIARDVRDARTEGDIVGNLGIMYKQLGEYGRAFDFFERALEMRRARGDVFGQLLDLDNEGNVKLLAGSAADSLRLHLQALALARQVGAKVQEAHALSNAAEAELALNRPDAALDHQKSALSLFESLRDVSAQASALDGIGLTLQRLGRIDEAAAALQQSLAILRENGRQYAEADLLFDLARLERDRGHDTQAIDDATQATDLDERLRQRITNPDLRVTFRARPRDLYALLIDLLQQHAPAETVRAFDVSERARARVLLESVAESRVDRSHFDALHQAEPLTSAEIQQRVLDDDTVLLEFALGDDRSWLWAVTQTEMVRVELPRRRDIDAAARRVYADFSSRSPRADASATAFSRMVLGGIAGRLRSDWRRKRLAIVPSGSLGYVPFAALPVPSGSRPARLSADHEIVMIPSASVIAALRADAARRPAPPRGIALVADPVFDAADPRVRTNGPRPFSAATRTSASLPRLAFSRIEAEAIATLAPSTSMLNATGFEASRAAILAGALDGYGIVHIATHGIVDNDRPAMSALVLSLVDKSGMREDGYLRQRDIYGLHLNADLVVLSACQTALGKDVRGEGLMGLTRAFMYAGAPRVVASLWEVDDRATAAFMTMFYRNLLRRRVPPAAALRAAQVEMSHDPRWKAPYYWAGFVLHGDWK